MSAGSITWSSMLTRIRSSSSIGVPPRGGWVLVVAQTVPGSASQSQAEHVGGLPARCHRPTHRFHHTDRLGDQLLVGDDITVVILEADAEVTSALDRQPREVAFEDVA